MTTDDPQATADADLGLFLAAMAAAGNPGSGRHELGVHKVEGWILEYDSMVGGAEVQAVVGIDGLVHARRGERSLRVEKVSASAWVTRGDDPTDARARFASQLDELLTFNGVTG